MQPPQSYKDQIAQKRALAEQKQREQKTQAALDGIATSGNIDDLINQVKEVQLATLLGNNKPPVILTDQTDLGDKINEAIKSLNSSEADNKQLNVLKSLVAAVEACRKSQSGDMMSLQKSFQAVEAAVKALDLSPVINVPTPKVTVKPAAVDLLPLQQTLRDFSAPAESADDGMDLGRYRAQDIDNSVTDKQYIGFMNPEGDWYIVENDIKADKLRYLFGKEGYQEAFANASTYEYSLLNEAINALTA